MQGYGGVARGTGSMYFLREREHQKPMNEKKDGHTQPFEITENSRTGKPETLPPNRHGESRALWEDVFPEDSGAFLDAYYGGKGNRNEITVIRDGQHQICAMIHWNPVELCCFGKQLTGDYLVAVATREDMRRKGLMAALLREGLVRRAERKMPFVFLTPAKEAYYTPFGFVTVGICFACGADRGPEAVPEVRAAAGVHSPENTKSAAGDSRKAGQEAVVPGGKGDGVFSGEIRKAGQDALAECVCGELRVREILPEEYDGVSKWINQRLKARYGLYAHRSVEYMITLRRELASEGGRIMGIFDGGPAQEGALQGVFLYTTKGEPEITEPVCNPEAEDQIYEAIRIWAGLLQAKVSGEGESATRVSGEGESAANAAGEGESAANAAGEGESAAKVAGEGESVANVAGEAESAANAAGKSENRESGLYDAHEESVLRAASMELDGKETGGTAVEIVGCSPARPGAHEKFKTMIRIVSLEECVRLAPAKEDFEQCIRVTDPILDENNGVFLMRLSPRGNRLERLREEREDCVALTIEELTALLFHDVFLNEAV